MIRAHILLLLLVATTAFAEPCRPDGIDLSIQRSCSSYVAFFRDETADQQTADCLEAAARKAAVDLIVLASDLAPKGTDDLYDALTLALTRIEVITPYRGTLQAPNGAVWDFAHHPQGRDYQVWCQKFRQVANELREPDARAQAVERFASKTDLRLMLDVNSTFTGNAGITLETPARVSSLAAKFPIDTTKNGPKFGPCATGDCTGLQDTAGAHACDVDAKLGRPITTECQALKDRGVTVASAHEDFEAGCPEGDGACQWFRRLFPFPGRIDPGWGERERGQWPEVTHTRHRCWVEAEQQGNAKRAQLCGMQHFIAHVCQAIGSDARLRVVMPDERLPASKLSQSFGGDQTCAELLPELVEAYGIE